MIINALCRRDLRYLLTFYFFIPVPYDENDIFFFFLVLVLEGLVGLHITINFIFFSIVVGA